jgi:hypothetical protein
MRDKNTVLSRKPEGKSVPLKPKRRWKVNIKVQPEEMSCESG